VSTTTDIIKQNYCSNSDPRRLGILRNHEVVLFTQAIDAEPHPVSSFQKKRGGPKIMVRVRSVLAAFAIDFQAEINESSLQIAPAILLSNAATPPPRCGYHDHESGQRWAAI
jgi:hypothetical protein